MNTNNKNSIGIRGKKGVLLAVVVLFFISCTTSSETLNREVQPSNTDRLTQLAELIKSSNPTIEGLVIAPDSNAEAPTLLITGVTNAAVGEIPSWSINVDQDKGVTTDPSDFTITPDAIISPHDNTVTLMVSFAAADTPAAYIVKTHVTGAPVTEWITDSASAANYITATFAGQGAPLTLTATTFSLSGLTNSGRGEAGSITVANLPTGFIVDPPEPISIPDPEGTSAATITPTPNTFTISEQGNSDNEQSYMIADIELAELRLFTPAEHIVVTDETTADVTASVRFVQETASSENKIIIKDLNNMDFVNDINLDKSYTFTIAPQPGIFTTPGNTPITFTINEPSSFLPGTETNSFTVTNNLGDPNGISYVLEFSFGGAAIEDWFTDMTYNNYLTAVTFEGQSATLGFDGTNFAITGSLTNVPDGSIALTTNAPPSGYAFAFDLSDPDNGGSSAVSSGNAGSITVAEIGNSANTKTYPVMITLAEYELVVMTDHTQANFAGRNALGTARITRDATGITIRVTGLENVPGTSGTGTLIITPPSSDPTYTINGASDPFMVTFNNPSGLAEIEVELPSIRVTADNVSATYKLVMVFASFVQPLRYNNMTVTYGGNAVTLDRDDVQSSGTSVSIYSSSFINSDSSAVEISIISNAGSLYTITPTMLTFNDPSGTDRASVSNTITLAYGSTISFELTVTVWFQASVLLRVASGGNAMPGDISPAGTIRVTNSCELLNANVISVTEPTYRISTNTPIVLYYDRAGTFPVNPPMYTNAMTLVIEDSSGTVVNDQFAVNVQYPICNSIADAGITGSGDTTNDPYIITTPIQLELISYLINISNTAFGGKHYKIADNTDIDLSSPTLPWSEAGSGNGPGFPYIAQRTNIYTPKFSGTFDCASNTLSGLYISTSTSNVGFFGSLSNGTIENCFLTDVKVKGFNIIGGLVGFSSGGTVRNSFVTGTVTGSGSNIGGLVGLSQDDSTPSVPIPSLISNSFAEVTVTATSSSVGGLVGGLLNSRIVNSYAAGSVRGNRDNIGGLVGSVSSANIENSYSSASVTGEMGSSYVGGLIGIFQYVRQTPPPIYVTNSYAIGSVTAEGSNVGAFIGYNGDFNAFSRDSSTNGVSNSYYPSGTTGGVGTDDPSATPPSVTGGLTALANLQVAQGTTDGTPFFGWDTSIWNFTAGQYPRLKTVVCANRQYNQAATDCTSTLQ